MNLTLASFTLYLHRRILAAVKAGFDSESVSLDVYEKDHIQIQMQLLNEQLRDLNVGTLPSFAKLQMSRFQRKTTQQLPTPQDWPQLFALLVERGFWANADCYFLEKTEYTSILIKTTLETWRNGSKKMLPERSYLFGRAKIEIEEATEIFHRWQHGQLWDGHDPYLEMIYELTDCLHMWVSAEVGASQHQVLSAQSLKKLGRYLALLAVQGHCSPELLMIAYLTKYTFWRSLGPTMKDHLQEYENFLNTWHLAYQVLSERECIDKVQSILTFPHP